jgi:hypothetical protein
MTRLTVVLLVVLVGCGSKPAPSPAPSQEPSSQPTPVVSEEPVPSASPTPTPHPVPSPFRPPPSPRPSPSVRPFPPLWPQEDPGCQVIRCNGDCVVTEVRSERSNTLATWSFCVQYPPERVGPPAGWKAK